MNYELGYTKGEWKLRATSFGIDIVQEKTGFGIVDFGTKSQLKDACYDFEVAKNNAKLCAAAPNMFELLKESLSVLEWFMGNTVHKDGDSESFFNIGANQIEQTKQLLTEITK